MIFHPLLSDVNCQVVETKEFFTLSKSHFNKLIFKLTSFSLEGKIQQCWMALRFVYSLELWVFQNF
jgi:hypothetical protein